MLAAYRGNISYISFHKIHIRPLRGGRPRTIVRVTSRDIRAGAVAGLGWPLTRETEGHKDIRFDVRACRLPREHKNISFHKIHIRPLRGGRPRTIVRVASRDIRADAEGGGGGLFLG